MKRRRHERKSFQQTIPALLLAPLGAIALVSWQIRGEGSYVPFLWMWFFTAVTCYVVEVLFVVPFLLWQPRLRQPPIWVGGLWGVLAALGTVVLLALLPPPPSGNRFWIGWGGAAYISICGLLSGVVYAFASRLRSGWTSN